ncbi:RHS repeat-associated core domain-containing protein [Pseudomonas sp. NY15463]|uniref:RHS repeat-associated core domain-containing protein n=1 Tax=Pseudomonas sp. NY15463 TaxID=3400361 RepID=UPI003A837FDB
MDDSLHAARLGDLILHPPLMAELVSTLTEAVVYAAATAAVAAAIGGAVVAVVGTGGAATVLTPLIAGALVGAAAMLPGGEDKSIGEQISDFSNWVGNSMFPPEPYGAIETGSVNTHINGLPAARAAGIVTGASAPEVPAEAPSILENIGSYAMLGASMMLPIIGLAQEINSIFNPPVTTPADPGTQPAELDTVKCSKHPTPNFVAQGSDKVFINGHPAARVGDKSTCDGPIGMTFSPNVRIGGGTVTVRDIHDGKSAAAKIIGIVAGMLLSRRIKSRSRPRNAPRPKTRIPPCKGHPVLVATGSKLLNGSEDLDFSLPGLIPLDWPRRYDSTDERTDGLLGMGWSLPYETRIERIAHPEGGKLWILVDEDGCRIELGRIEPGNALISTLDGVAIFHQDHGITVVEDIYSGQYQVFKTDPLDENRSRLVQLGDRNLNRVELLYDDHGRLHYLVDTFGRTAVRLDHDSLHTQRVQAVWRLDLRPGDRFEVASQQLLVSYGYTGDGQLAQVHDASGQCVRRFTYTEAGYMASQALANGAVHHYEWARFSVPPDGIASGLSLPNDFPPLLEEQPMHQWRVIRHTSESGERYDFEYDLALGLTHISDSLGRRESFQWDLHYTLYRYVDALGNEWQETFQQGQLIASIEPDGSQWSYTYDAIGRLIGSKDPLGRLESIHYGEHWALPLSISSPDGATWRMRYDSHGNVLCETDPLGANTQYRYDSRGQLLAITDAHGHERQLKWNDRGQLLSYQDCSGNTTHYRYTERGELAEAINPRGERTRHRYDVRGYLIESQRPDGRSDHFEVNAGGQLIRHRDPAERITQWNFDASGRLRQRIDPMGQTIDLHYDAYGRLLELSNENNECYRFEWDALDRAISQQNLDGSGHTYDYDARGTITRVVLHPAPGQAHDTAAQIHQLEHDAVGRLLRKHTADGTTEFCYDNADNLLAVTYTDTSGNAQQLSYSYDLNARLLSETSAAGKLAYAYDELGNLQRMTLPDQRQVNLLRYGSGHLHQINLDGRVICDFERDSLHEEVLRTQGRLQTRTRYDRCGRLSQKAIHYSDASNASLALLQKDYRYDAGDNLLNETHTQTLRPGSQHPAVLEQVLGRFHQAGRGNSSHQDVVTYDYGATPRVHAVTRMSPQRNAPIVELYGYDRAGNLLEGYQPKGHARHNQVTVHQNNRYRYDGFGRLAEKRSANGLLQRFEYDAEHRLVRVLQQRGSLHERVEFSYDPLGRRISKCLYRNGHPQPVSRTQFLWQGLRLLQEVQDGKPSLYVYAEPERHEPLARIDGMPGQEVLHFFHTNLAGLPEQLTDENGDTVWHSDYLLWGKSREEWHCPGQNRQQNLRMQGQYLDRETGLHYNTFRYYDPDIGRFTQPDPLGLEGSLNLYAYAPNPLSWIDPLGLSECSLLDRIIHDANKVASPGGEITARQAQILRGNLPVVQRRNATQNRVVRKEFVKTEKALIKQWETNTNRSWPDGATAHHVIPLESGGANKWWNLMPTHGTLPNHSLPGIPGPHAAGGVLRTTIQQGRKALPPKTITDLRL